MENIFGGFNLGSLASWAYNAWVWVLVLFAGVFLIILGLVWNRHNKLIYPSKEIISFGNGKIGMQKLRVGRFSKRTWFFGLIELAGEKIFKTSDKREVQNCSTEDCQEIEGKMGFLLKRKDDDPKILVPISKVEIDNYELIASIASGDFRDTGSRIIGEKQREMQAMWEKVVPIVLSFASIAFALFSVIMVIQFAQGSIDKMIALQKEGCTKAYVPPSTSP